MRRRLSFLEHIVDGNIVYLVRLVGTIDTDRLQSALARVQRKHPALRALIHEGPDGLYYEADSAPGIPLRIVTRVTDDDCQRECRAELTTALPYDQPQLRVVWLRSEREHDLLLTTSHRVCDGMSLLTIVREVLRSLHTDEELIPYAPITTRDIIGDYQPPRPLKRKLTMALLNGLLRLIPRSRRTPDNNERSLEWTADRAFSHGLKERCKAEGASVHAAFLVALDRALLAAFGEKKLPKWIENPIDIRRGRFAALKSDMVFFGGGNFRVRTGQARDMEFWARARAVNDAIRRDVEQEVADIPSNFHFSQMLRPVTRAQVQSVIRLGDALRMNGSWNRFALSNLGNIELSGGDAPFRATDLRIYMHSQSFRVLCLVIYTLDGEMHFHCMSDEKCMSRGQMDALHHELMAQLRQQVQPPDTATNHEMEAVAH